MKKQSPTVVGDTAHDLAHDLKVDIATLGADALKVASDYIAPKARDLADYLAPRVKDVADYVQPRAADLGRRGVQFAAETRENLQPKVVQFASDARDTLQPRLVQLADDARENLQPRVVQFATDARENLQPYLEDARERLQPHLDDARERLQPHLDDALARVQPLVDAGRDRLQADVLPRLSEAIDNVASMPQSQDAKDRLLAARAALAGDLKLPEPEPRRSFGKVLLQLILAGGLLAGVAYAIRRFLAPEDSGWQAHEPSDAYRREEDAVGVGDVAADLPVADDAADEAGHAAFGLTDPEQEAPAPRRAAAESVAESADPFVVSPYGAGSYVGTDPSPDFFIKGNERSMKYHVKGGGGFERTIADVWFNSEDAARAAGFVRAQR